jgi:uncharacterized phage protein (TIGR01671 family)
MREVLFRGQREDNGEWVFGRATFYRDGKFLQPESIAIDTGGYIYEVKPETVGEYTGLKDSNGVKIFEGDILQKYGGKNSVLVRWDDESCGFVYDCTLSKHTPHENVMSLSLFHFRSADYEIIGNIHDNKNLLEEA